MLAVFLLAIAAYTTTEAYFVREVFLQREAAFEFLMDAVGEGKYASFDDGGEDRDEAAAEEEDADADTDSGEEDDDIRGEAPIGPVGDKADYDWAVDPDMDGAILGQDLRVRRRHLRWLARSLITFKVLVTLWIASYAWDWGAEEPQEASDGYRYFIVVGLIASAIGDFFLAIDGFGVAAELSNANDDSDLSEADIMVAEMCDNRSVLRRIRILGLPKKLFFLLGLVAFFGAHIYFVRALLLACGVTVSSPSQAAALVWDNLFGLHFGNLLALTYAGFMVAYLDNGSKRKLGGLKWPVVAYMGCILFMMRCAHVRWLASQDLLDSTPLELPNGPQTAERQSARDALFGALLFGLSDSILAVEKFRRRVPFGRFGIMVTYWLALFFFARSVVVLA